MQKKPTTVSKIKIISMTDYGYADGKFYVVIVRLCQGLGRMKRFATKQEQLSYKKAVLSGEVA